MNDGDDGSGEICKTLRNNGLTEIEDIFALSNDQIDDLSYKENNKRFTLTLGQRNMLRILSAFNTNQIRSNKALEIKDWINITKDQFSQFRIIYNPADYLNPSTSNPAPSTSGLGPGMAASRIQDPVRDFKRGIKRDPSLFPILKDAKQWDPWYIDTKAQARAQDVEEVLDDTYVPSKPEDKAVFDHKQKYMYAVFTKTLLTDKGKSLVRDHEKNYDAQKIHKKLLDYAQRSTKASVDSSQLLSYITSTRLGTGSWKGSSHSFILHWQNQVRKYEQLVPASDRFSATIKRTMLENAVHSIQDLRAVKDQANQLQVRLGTAITYEEYCSLLLSAALTYDSQFTTKVNSKGTVRSVYSHNTTNEHNSMYNIDSDLQSLEANDTILEDTYVEAYSTQLDVTPRLSNEKWAKLSLTAKKTWNLLDAHSKGIILGQQQKSQLQSATSQKRQVNFALEENVGSSQDPQDKDKFHDSMTGALDKDSPLEDNKLLAHVTQQKNLPPGHLHRLLSSSMNNSNKIESTPNGKPYTEINIDGKLYRQVNYSKIIYCHSEVIAPRRGALVDRGANGGICGDDVRVISKTTRNVDVQGIDNHQIVNIPIVTAGAVAITQRGPVIIIMNQYAHIGHGKTIHSSGQLEMFGNDVNDKSIRVKGGKQCIQTQDGYCIPLNIIAGLPYMSLRPYTDDEWEDLPHIVLTNDSDWDPSVLDNTIDNDETWFDAISDLPDEDTHSLFDHQGNYQRRHTSHHIDINDSDLENGILPLESHLYRVFNNIITSNERKTTQRDPDYASFIPNFGWQALDTIERTFKATTQYIRIPMSTHLTRHFKSPFPALNVNRRQEAVATDTVYADVPAIDCGHTQAQFYCGIDSLVCDAYGMKTDKQFVNTFEDIIRQRGAMDKLISDGAKVETTGKAQDIFRAYVIGNWHSEAYQQQQNFAERKYQQVKNTTNRLLERAGSPAYTWLLALLYVCFLLNHTANETLGWRTPLERLTATTPDMSPLLSFYWWQPVTARSMILTSLLNLGRNVDALLVLLNMLNTP